MFETFATALCGTTGITHDLPRWHQRGAAETPGSAPLLLHHSWRSRTPISHELPLLRAARGDLAANFLDFDKTKLDEFQNLRGEPAEAAEAAQRVAAAQEDKLLEEYRAAMEENRMFAEEAARPHGNEASYFRKGSLVQRRFSQRDDV